MEELRQQIKEELISKGEYIDSCSEIYNMNFYGQKEYRGVPTVLGHLGQIGINLILLKNSFIKIFTEPSEEQITNKENLPTEEKQEKQEKQEKPPDSEEKDKEKEKKPNENSKKGGSQIESQQTLEAPLFLDFDETVKKLIDLYLLKCSPFYFVIPNDILEQIKSMNENISTIDDIWKIENEEIFNKITSIIIETNLQISADPVLDLVSDILTKNFESIDLKALLTSMITTIFSICKTSTEFDPKDKIKFISIQALPTDDGKYFGICDLKQPSVPKAKSSNELAAQLLAKKNIGKKDAKGRPYFEPIFTEKVYISPLISDKMKILAMNSKYEKMLRNNLLTCLQRLEILFANEGDNLMTTMDDVYNQFWTEFKKKLEEKYSKDVLDINIDMPPEGQ